jgi:hypothetical protein
MISACAMSTEVLCTLLMFLVPLSVPSRKHSLSLDLLYDPCGCIATLEPVLSAAQCILKPDHSLLCSLRFRRECDEPLDELAAPDA